MRTLRLFDTLLSLQGVDLPPLSIEGDLPDYSSESAYEGRLNIINSIGDCQVEMLNFRLPPGAYSYVDQSTKQIVLKWGAYTKPAEPATTVPNGDFEDGDDGTWDKGNGWYIEADGAKEGIYCGAYRGKGVSEIKSIKVPYTPGTLITAKCQFQQGASKKGNVTARIMLFWFDKDGIPLPGGEGKTFNAGNMIRSGSNGAWHESKVTAKSDSLDAALVAVGISSNRKKQNKVARVDLFTWDHKYQEGTDNEQDFAVTFKVTDSANRVAYWTGLISERAIWITSKPYTLYQYEGLVSSSSEVASIKHSGKGAEDLEGMYRGSVLQLISRRIPLKTYSEKEGMFRGNSKIDTISRRTIVKSSSETEGLFRGDSKVISFNRKIYPSISQYIEEALFRKSVINSISRNVP